MKTVFADTYFFIAAVNSRDADHAAALDYFGRDQLRFVTTAWVLSEVASALAPRSSRTAFIKLHNNLRNDSAVEIVPPTPELFASGIDLYASRPDKEWSLTDCISFVVMHAKDIREALTGDHHFTQAGFTILLGQ